MDKISTGRYKVLRLLSDTWRCSVGARKLPHEGNNDGGLVSRLPSPYNRVQPHIVIRTKYG